MLTKKSFIVTMSGSDTLKLFDIMFRPFTDNACESDTKGRFTQGVKSILKPNPCCPLVEILKSAPRPLHKESRPKVGNLF